MSVILSIFIVFTGALGKFMEHNQGYLPQRIVIYRDGVGDGQISYVYQHEVALIKVCQRAFLFCVHYKNEEPLCGVLGCVILDFVGMVQGCFCWRSQVFWVVTLSSRDTNS
jgi:hypothetical protein